MSRPSLLVSLSIVALVAACGSDSPPSSSAQIRAFCQGYAASNAFSCCSPADRQEPTFGLRYRFASEGDCITALTNQETSGAGKQTFDPGAGETCLQHLSSRTCGEVVTTAVARAEQEAGCFRLFRGSAKEGQGCATSDDCETGLVCPPIEETGTAFCAKPVGRNEDCYGKQANSVDHPACAEGFICQYIGDNPAGCPLPPCEVFKCVPPYEEGELCTGTECGPGLSCKPRPTDGALACLPGGPSGAGTTCRLTEHCAPGLYCDVAAGKCAERKADGSPCSVGNNALYECRGVCRAENGAETCAAFCGR